jgi:hypothetical protein
MADSFKLLGSYETAPLGQPLSFAPNVIAQISEGKTLKVKELADLTLSVDSAVAVPFGGVVNANVILLKATGGKVKARFTSADGTAQAIPFDTYLILMSDTVPFTAIDLTRVASTLTTVRVFLGEKS